MRLLERRGLVHVSDFAHGSDVAEFDQPTECAGRDWREWAATSFMRDLTARVIVSRSLKVLAINPRATDLIAATTVLSISDGQLRAIPDRPLARLRHAAVTANERESVQLLGAMDSGVLLAAGAASDAPTEPVTLTLRVISTAPELGCADLRDVFGLTPAEQRTILGLLSGRSPPEIADETGRSILTVRTHLKRAYVKIGVRSHGQLFARLLPLLQLVPPRGNARADVP